VKSAKVFLGLVLSTISAEYNEVGDIEYHSTVPDEAGSPAAIRFRKAPKSVKSAGREAFHVTLKRELDGWFVATCKELPEAVSQGADIEEATKNIKEAIAAVLEDIYQSEVSTSDIEVVVEREE